MDVTTKDIQGFEGLYTVDSTGRVYSTRKNLYLKGKTGKDRYKEYSLYRDGVVTYKRGHRLVSEAFIPNPENKPVVNHKNNIPDDNRVENLEWCSVEHNTRHALADFVNTKGKCLSNLNREDFEEMIRLYSSGYSYSKLITYFRLTCTVDDIGQVLAGKKHREVSGITIDLRDNRNHDSFTLSDQDVWNILSVYYVGKFKQSTICKAYNLLPGLVSRIVNGKRRQGVFERFHKEVLV